MNKKTMIVWMALCGACAADEELGERELPGQRVNELAVDASAVREQLLARIDSSRLALGPVAEVAESTPFDAPRVLAALERATGARFAERGEGSGERWSAASESHAVEIDHDDGMVAIHSEAAFKQGAPRAPDALFEAKAGELLQAIAPDAKHVELDVMHVGATTRDIVSGKELADERVATKVFALRTLGGLRVAGHRLVATYHTDGTLRGVNGKWPQLDLARSKLSSQLSAAEARSRAVDVLVEHGVPATDKTPILLESFYAVEPSSEGVTVVLRGAARVNTPEGRGERHEFAL